MNINLKLDRFLSDWKDEIEQGLLCPLFSATFLDLGDEQFTSDALGVWGSPPEFSAIARAVLDCFAIALLSAPGLGVLQVGTVCKCQLVKERGLALHLTSWLVGERGLLPLPLGAIAKAWVGQRLRNLATLKSIRVDAVYWVRSQSHSIFILDYPGPMVPRAMPGFGDRDAGASERWPCISLTFPVVDGALIRRAEQLITLADTTEDQIQ